MSQLHVLFIPAWFDISYEYHFAKIYHSKASDLSSRLDGKVGLLYGDFQYHFLRQKTFEKEDLPYRYLGRQAWSPPKAGWGWKIWEWQYLKTFEQYLQNHGMPTVVHGYSILGLAAAAAIHKRYRIPYIYTEVLGAFIAGRTSPRLIRKAQKAAKKATVITGLSPGMVKAMERVYEKKALLIPESIASNQFIPKPSNTPYPSFIAIGAPAYTKGFDVLIQAFSRVRDQWPEARLTLVDDIPDRHLIDPIIVRLNLKDHIHFTGAVPHHQIPDLLQKSDVLISASREESLGMTMIEAISCGIPVVATDTPGSRFIVTPDTGIIVPREDPQALAQAMVATYNSRHRYDPEKMHRYIQGKFDEEVIWPAWIDIYEKCSQKNQDI